MAKAIDSSGKKTSLKGCSCKKSQCIKNYCDCYQSMVICTQYCKCVGCRNTEPRGSMPPKAEVAKKIPKTKQFNFETLTILPQDIEEGPCTSRQAAAIERKQIIAYQQQQQKLQKLQQQKLQQQLQQLQLQQKRELQQQQKQQLLQQQQEQQQQKEAAQLAEKKIDNILKPDIADVVLGNLASLEEEAEICGINSKERAFLLINELERSLLLIKNPAT